jgi:hypothetical protein
MKYAYALCIKANIPISRLGVGAHMTHKPMVLAVVTGVLSAPLFTSTSYGFSLFPESMQSGSSPVLASCMAVALLAGGCYWVQRVRRFSKSQEERVQRQLRAMEKLAMRTEEAERTLFKSEYLTHATRTELRHALDAISTDTVRAIGNLRRHQDLPDAAFRKLMARSDEVFDILDTSMTTALPESDEGSEPLLMPRRSNPLPRPKPQSRPQDALSSLDPVPLQAATLPDLGMTSILLGGGMFYAADDQGSELAGSTVDGGMD